MEALVGTRFPGGTFEIGAHEDWLLRDVIGAEPGDGAHAHPLWGFAAPQRSMGITIDEIFELCGARAADGPLLGDSEIVSDADLLIGQNYVVEAGIVDARRKQGRSGTTFDVVHFTATTFDLDHRPVGRLTNSFILPRTPREAVR